MKMCEKTRFQARNLTFYEVISGQTIYIILASNYPGNPQPEFSRGITS